jgi:hypothetical protein
MIPQNFHGARIFHDLLVRGGLGSLLNVGGT